MAKKSTASTPEQILAANAPLVQYLSKRLRELVKKTVPEAEEKAYPGWRALGYAHPKIGYFCAIFPLKDMAKLAFEYGVLLPDPFNLLKAGPSKGNRVRYVEIKSVDDIDEEKIRRLIESSVALKKQSGSF